METGTRSHTSARRTCSVGDAKRIIVQPISASDAARIVRAIHYSGKTTQNSQVHLGVFLDGRCGGALQFGPPMDRRRVIGLVEGTLWNEMLELNRMALADWLPRNSESRVIAYSLRWLRKMYPWLKWILSFADGTQCGDGTIYRASGFVLTGIKKNTTLLKMPNGRIVSRLTLNTAKDRRADGKIGSAVAREAGAVALPGFQIRYIYFLDPAYRSRLTVPVIPFADIDARGARMYRGKRCGGSVGGDAPAYPAGEGGSNPTPPLRDNSTFDGPGRTFEEIKAERAG